MDPTRIGMALIIAAACTISACANSSSRGVDDYPTSDTPLTSEPETSAEEAPSPAPAEPVEEPPEPIDPTEIVESLSDGSPMQLEEGTVDKDKTLLTDGHYAIMEECGDHLLVGRAPARGDSLSEVLVVDPRSGKEIAKFPYHRGLDCVEGLVIIPGSKSKGPAVFRTGDAALKRPKISASNVSVAWIVPIVPAQGAPSRFVVQAKRSKPQGARPEYLFGLWSFDETEVELDREMEAAIIGAREVAGKVQMRTAMNFFNPSPCPVLTIDEDDVECELRGLRPTDVSWFAGGWSVFEDPKRQTVVVASPEGEEIEVGPEACSSPLMIATFTSPPAVLSGCRNKDERIYGFWTSDGDRRASWSHEYPEQTNYTVGIGVVEAPIITSWMSNTRDPVAYFFDMRTARMWMSEPLFPLFFQESESPALVADVYEGEEIEVSAIDSETGERRSVVTYDDCPGFLRQDDRLGNRAIVRCLVQPEKSLHRFVHQWSEVIDLASETRWRIDGYPVLLTEDGAIVSNRKKSTAESWSTGTELWRVRLR